MMTLISGPDYTKCPLNRGCPLNWGPLNRGFTVPHFSFQTEKEWLQSKELDIVRHCAIYLSWHSRWFHLDSLVIPC